MNKIGIFNQFKKLTPEICYVDISFQNDAFAINDQMINVDSNSKIDDIYWINILFDEKDVYEGISINTT